jgi:chaperonin cofactor prefoldin
MSDDLTKDLPGDNQTRPTIETVLERINALGESLAERIGKVETELADGFRRVERKIELLNRDFLTIRADQEHLLQRIEGLESKIS